MSLNNVRLADVLDAIVMVAFDADGHHIKYGIQEYGVIFSDKGDGDIATVQGVVKRINYTRHGEANGVVLESGDFVHLKPAGMKRVALKVGDHVSAEGPAALMPLGQQVVEAETVNGSSIMSKRPAGAGNRRSK